VKKGGQIPIYRQHALTIDVEEWYHPELVREFVPEAARTPRLEGALAPILDLLRECSTKATFFVMGEVARKNPGLVADLHRQGHEIASHGMSHRPLWDLDAEGFRRELRQFRDVVAAIDPSIRIRGYRAPTFSLDARTSWALAVLADEGYEYDSSIFPFKNHVYGVAGAPLAPYRPDPADLTQHSDDGPILEFPLSVLRFAGIRLPVSGGFYLRALPYGVLRWALGRIGRERSFVIYCHPWEFDAETPRQDLSAMNHWITYTGIRGGHAKLACLLREFSFTRADKVLFPHGRR
jgi:peptidoglycan-N-acetylglucosamine deacetylase